METRNGAGKPRGKTGWEKPRKKLAEDWDGVGKNLEVWNGVGKILKENEERGWESHGGKTLGMEGVGNRRRKRGENSEKGGKREWEKGERHRGKPGMEGFGAGGVWGWVWESLQPQRDPWLHPCPGTAPYPLPLGVDDLGGDGGVGVAAGQLDAVQLRDPLRFPLDPQDRLPLLVRVRQRRLELVVGGDQALGGRDTGHSHGIRGVGAESRFIPNIPGSGTKSARKCSENGVLGLFFKNF